MKRRSFMSGLMTAPTLAATSGLLTAQQGLGAENLQFVQSSNVRQRRVIGAHMNSAWWHSDYGCVPLWLHRMSLADGGKRIAARGQFDDFNTAFKDPPMFQQIFPEVVAPSPGIRPYSNWAQHYRDRYTDIVYVPDNFQGPPLGARDQTDPNIGGLPPSGGADDYVTEFTETITIREANTDGDQIHWLYEIWAVGSSNVQAGLLFMETDGSATPERFANWRGRTTTDFGYSSWFDRLVADTQANLPAVASRIKMIPVARALVDVMENTSASALTCGDWFEDDAPHGRHHMYAVAAAIVYSSMFEEQAPTPIWRGATINSTIQNNWPEITARIFSYLQTEGFI